MKLLERIRQRSAKIHCEKEGHDVDEFTGSRLVAFGGHDPDYVTVPCRRCGERLTWTEFCDHKYGRRR